MMRKRKDAIHLLAFVTAHTANPG